MTLEWVFFDIGDVLFDEDAPHMLYFHTILQTMRKNGIAVEWDIFHAQILQSVRIEPSHAVQVATQHFIPDQAESDRVYHEGRMIYEEIRKPRPYGVLLNDFTPVLQEMKKEFRLGIIANQHAEVLTALEDYGIASLFDIKLIDEVVGVSKPAPAIFRMALDQAGCAPESALMVGDRPDTDIGPANTLGMRTLRFRRGLLYSHIDPKTESEHAELMVTCVSRILPAVRQIAASPRINA